jgi:hypothetical protein
MFKDDQDLPDSDALHNFRHFSTHLCAPWREVYQLRPRVVDELGQCFSGKIFAKQVESNT